MDSMSYKDLFLKMTTKGEDGIRRWNVSSEICDPFDFELAGILPTDDQVNSFMHWQIDEFEKDFFK